MNPAFPDSFPALLADIVVGPPSPHPPPELIPGPFAGSGPASFAFWGMAVVAIVALWWLRQRRSASAPVGRASVVDSK